MFHKLLWICLTILIVSENEQTESIEIKVGVLSYEGCCYTTFSAETSVSAITIAQEQLQKEGILTNISVSVIMRLSMTESSGVANVVHLVQTDNVDVIFGSPSSRGVSIPAAHLTSEWNFPQISWVSTSGELSDKSRFGTFLRTSGPFSKIGIAMVNLFEKFQWKKVAMFYVRNGVCLYALDGIKQAFYDANITEAQTISYLSADRPSIVKIDQYLQLIKRASRIIIICDSSITRMTMLRACENGMCNGDYVFIMPSINVADDFFTSYYWSNGESDDPLAKEAYKHLLFVSVASWEDEETEKVVAEFRDLVVQKMAEPPWNNDYAVRNNLTGSYYATYLYDAMYFYGLWLNHSMTTGVDHKDGRAMLTFSNDISYHGIAGTVDFDRNGDKSPNYWIWDFKDESGYPTILAVAKSNRDKVIREISGFRWLTEDGQVPVDTPECGFYNELCPTVESDSTPVVLAASLTVLALLLVGGIAAYMIRKRQIEIQMMKMIWKVDINEIEMRKSRAAVGSKKSFSQSQVSLAASNHDVFGLTRLGMYKGQLVAVRNLDNKSFCFTKKDLLELKEMREMTHNNINPFLGACVDSPSACILFTYCPKGSLQDILENDDIKLDSVFKYSLTSDLVNAIYFLHQSIIGSHGRLKSNNCLVDNRWVLKVTDYGIGRFLDYRDQNYQEENEKYKSLLWTAPEILSANPVPPNGSKEGDIYSFGIILHEIFYRMGTFAGNAHMTAKDIIGRVRNREATPCRPEIFGDVDDVSPAIVKLMQLCWLDIAKDRPSISTIKSYTKKNIHGVEKNIMDVMLQRLEKYASNLEEIVEERTQQLMEEKLKTDKLLYRMMPASCAEKLKSGEMIEPEMFDSVTIFFSDIVGFTTIASMSTPIQVVDLLNDLYTTFDSIIADHDAYKVETIGDAYLVVSGLPTRNGDLHVGVIADMSLAIMEGLKGFRVRHLPDERLAIRIGMHTGPCCAGVVGLSMPRYCLFGDTVNTASRMESNGMRQKIHLSEAAHAGLHKLGGYQTSFRGEMEIKGKGMMATYWLDGKLESTKGNLMNLEQ